MNVNATGSMQQMQMRKMDGTGGGQGNGAGKMAQETLSTLSQESQSEIKSFLQTLDQATRKDAMSQIAKLDSSTMSVEDLTTSIKDLLGIDTPTQTAVDPLSFSVYA